MYLKKILSKRINFKLIQLFLEKKERKKSSYIIEIQLPVEPRHQVRGEKNTKSLVEKRYVALNLHNAKLLLLSSYPSILTNLSIHKRNRLYSTLEVDFVQLH